jgi:hypothetical protein
MIDHMILHTRDETCPATPCMRIWNNPHTMNRLNGPMVAMLYEPARIEFLSFAFIFSSACDPCVL